MHINTNVSCADFDVVIRVKYKLHFEAPPRYKKNDSDIVFLLFKDDLSEVRSFVTLKLYQEESLGMGLRNMS